MGAKDIKDGIQEEIREEVQSDGTVKRFKYRFTINPMDTADLPDGMMSCNFISEEEIIE